MGLLASSHHLSQVDLFDPKPLLEKWNGKPFPSRRDKTQFANVGNEWGLDRATMSFAASRI